MGLRNGKEFNIEQLEEIKVEDATHFKIGSDNKETDWLFLDYDSIKKLQAYLDKVMEKIL